MQITTQGVVYSHKTVDLTCYSNSAVLLLRVGRRSSFLTLTQVYIEKYWNTNSMVGRSSPVDIWAKWGKCGVAGRVKGREVSMDLPHPKIQNTSPLSKHKKHLTQKYKIHHLCQKHKKHLKQKYKIHHLNLRYKKRSFWKYRKHTSLLLTIWRKNTKYKTQHFCQKQEN